MVYPNGYSGPRFKVCLIGDGGVGKTAIIEHLLGKRVQNTYMLTIGADISTYQVADGYDYKFQFWDLAGQERFDVVRSLFYRGSHAAIIVFDVSRPDSLKNLQSWQEELLKHVKVKIPCVVVGNKCDLSSKVNPEDITKFLEILKEKLSTPSFTPTIPYIETSALNGIKVLDIINVLINKINEFIEA